jgi:hypothetical protein
MIDEGIEFFIWLVLGVLAIVSISILTLNTLGVI